MSGAEELDTGNFPTTQNPPLVFHANNAVIFQPSLPSVELKRKRTGDYLHKKKAKSSAKWPSETNLVASAARFSRFSTPFRPPPKLGERDENQNQKKRNERANEQNENYYGRNLWYLLKLCGQLRVLWSIFSSFALNSFSCAVRRG